MLLKMDLILGLIPNFTPLKKHNYFLNENRRFCFKTHWAK